MGDTVETTDERRWRIYPNKYIQPRFVTTQVDAEDVDLTRADLVALLALIDSEEATDE